MVWYGTLGTRTWLGTMPWPCTIYSVLEAEVKCEIRTYENKSLNLNGNGNICCTFNMYTTAAYSPVGRRVDWKMSMRNSGTARRRAEKVNLFLFVFCFVTMYCFFFLFVFFVFFLFL